MTGTTTTPYVQPTTTYLCTGTMSVLNIDDVYRSSSTVLNNDTPGTGKKATIFTQMFSMVFARLHCNCQINVFFSGYNQPKLDSPTAWSSAVVDMNQWHEIDLSVIRIVTGIKTQGQGDNPNWVTSYKVQYRATNIAPWSDVDGGFVFTGIVFVSAFLSYVLLVLF